MEGIRLLVSSSYRAAVSRHKLSSQENMLINNSICLLLLAASLYSYHSCAQGPYSKLPLHRPLLALKRSLVKYTFFVKTKQNNNKKLWT